MGVLLDELSKHGGATNCTKTDTELNETTATYLKATNSGLPMIKATPQGGFGERVATPYAANPDETELVVDQDIFSQKVRELVTGAGGKYSVKADRSDGQHPLVHDLTNLERHSGFLRALVAKAIQRRKAKGSASGSASASGSGSYSVTVGDTPSSGEESISTCDEDGHISKSFVKRVTDMVRDAVEKRLSAHVVKCSVNPATMTKAQLSSLRRTLRPGTPAHTGITRLMERAN